MTREEVKNILTVLKKIKNRDGNVDLAIAIYEKQLAIFKKKYGSIKRSKL